MINTPTLAEKMDERRERILNTAEQLIRKDKTTNFSMRALALEAGFSTATSYNLIGTKAKVLYSLLNRSVEGIQAQGDEFFSDLGAAERLLAASEIAVTFFASDPDFYRPLMGHLLGIPDPIHRPQFMSSAYSFWRSAAAGFPSPLAEPTENGADQIAKTIHVAFTGALDLWVHEEFTEAQFREHMAQTIKIIAFGFCPTDGS